MTLVYDQTTGSWVDSSTYSASDQGLFAFLQGANAPAQSQYVAANPGSTVNVPSPATVASLPYQLGLLGNSVGAQTALDALYQAGGFGPPQPLLTTTTTTQPATQPVQRAASSGVSLPAPLQGTPKGTGTLLLVAGVGLVLVFIVFLARAGR